jgi:heptosyltransferase-3
LTHKVKWEHASRPFIDYPRDLLRVLFNDASLDRPLSAYYPPQHGNYEVPETAYVLVQTGTGNRIREWPDERWIELVRGLTKSGSFVVIAGAGPRERQRASTISDAVAGGVLNLCDTLAWDEFVTLVARAAHVVCLDSSTSHLASAFRVPSTVLMSGMTDFKQFGPANERATILTFKTPCAPCFRARGCYHMACIRNVTVDAALQAVLSEMMGKEE